jgi:iron(II)-dependent oxidoreductase
MTRDAIIGDANSAIVIIPEGCFIMGSDCGRDNEHPSHRVWLDSFGIGKFPVTNSEYKVFLEDTRIAAPPFWGEPMFSVGDQPVVGITWYDAVAYCEWLSQWTRKDFRLPTEAEWERAARGERVAALFPWGDAPPCERLQIGCDPDTGGPARVGVNAPNDFGLHDMSEGVHEWCSDYYAPDYYGKSPERNPQGPSAGGRRVSRGGSWRHKVKFSRCAARTSLPPEFKYADYGFRVALTL